MGYLIIVQHFSGTSRMLPFHNYVDASAKYRELKASAGKQVRSVHLCENVEVWTVGDKE